MSGVWNTPLRHPLVLASASPRRSWILSQLGIEHEVDPSQFDESSVQVDSPRELVLQLARAKALEVSRRRPTDLVLGADTVVYLSPKVLGKPSDAQEAVSMLASLSGRTHVVWTGIHLARNGQPLESEAVASEVTFRNLGSRDIEAYVRTGDPLDKAGAYGIQGLGLGLVERLHGCYYAVAGLPIDATLRLLQQHQEIP